MKGQSAAEYVITYGWAILALTIVIAALLASGVLSPNYMISEECNLGSNMPCTFIVFNEEGKTKMNIAIQNGFPYKINISRLEVKLTETGQSFDFENMAPTVIESGASTTYKGTLNGGQLPQGSIKRFSASVEYYSCAPEISEGGGCSTSKHTISGKIVARIVSK